MSDTEGHRSSETLEIAEENNVLALCLRGRLDVATTGAV
jgi:hypothetical protein